MTSATEMNLSETRGEANSPQTTTVRWIGDFQAALQSGNVETVLPLFHDEAVFRDLLALSWRLRNSLGTEELRYLLKADETSLALSRFELREESVALSEDGETLTAFFSFANASGAGNGYVELRATSAGWKAKSLVLALDQLTSRVEQINSARPDGKHHGPLLGRASWAEQQDSEFREQEPAVVILGAGHNGLMLAARLKALGVPALVVERNDRVGDNWRKRYSALALHTPIAADHLPYLGFPTSWPRFTPKDKMGDFLESYATLLDLQVWTGSSAENVAYDSESGRWTLDVVRADGSARSLSPRHLVFATGVNGAPVVPNLPGIEDFAGETVHAAVYQGYEPWVGKRAVVIGSGVSGHDIAQDLGEHGVDVTMVQRSETIVMDGPTFHEIMYPDYISGAMRIEDADLKQAATPFGLLPSRGAAQIEAANKLDRELLAALEVAGFKVGTGPNGTGVLGSIFGEGGTGYHYNVGAAELIIDGTIKLVHGAVTRLTQNGVELEGGQHLDADFVVFATGYERADGAVKEVLGEAFDAQLDRFYRVGADREFGKLWQRTGIDGLWFMYSLGIDNGRFYSKLLALQIAAAGDGILA